MLRGERYVRAIGVQRGEAGALHIDGAAGIGRFRAFASTPGRLGRGARSTGGDHNEATFAVDRRSGLLPNDLPDGVCGIGRPLRHGVVTGRASVAVVAIPSRVGCDCHRSLPYSANILLLPLSHCTVMSPPFVACERPSSKQIKFDVDPVPVSLYSANAAIVLPEVTAVSVMSAASNTPFVTVFEAKLPDEAITPDRSL